MPLKLPRMERDVSTSSSASIHLGQSVWSSGLLKRWRNVVLKLMLKTKSWFLLPSKKLES